MMRCTTLALLATWATAAAAAAPSLTTLYSFKGGHDGGDPSALVVGADGIFYGATIAGDGMACPHALEPSGCGNLFQFNLANDRETVLHRFAPVGDGDAPTPLALAVHGDKIYGVTYGSYTIDSGVVFRLDITKQRFATLQSFSGGAEGGTLNNGLTFQGNALFGTAFDGGTGVCLYGSPCGLVFRIDAKTGAETVLHNFAGGTDGASPRAGLVYVNGMLYGTTQAGGGAAACTNGCGTLFRVDPQSGAETVLHSFQGGAEGSAPGALVAHGGSLYGTLGFGVGNGGAVFQFNIASGAESLLYTFPPAGLAQPQSGLVYDAGALYGIDTGGLPNCYDGDTCGYIFKLDTVTGAEKTLYQFTNGTDGGGPESLVVYQGALYGVTGSGGTYDGKCLLFGEYDIGCGTIFRLVP
jgi:uncharacterized repeat protein (TIGR03803 family)